MLNITSCNRLMAEFLGFQITFVKIILVGLRKIPFMLGCGMYENMSLSVESG